MLQKSIAARLGRSVQCGVKRGGGWSYTGHAYIAKNDESDIAFCAKYAGGNSIDESKFETACQSASSNCIFSGSPRSCVKDDLKTTIKIHSGFCGDNDFLLFISNSPPAYNGYSGQVERVDGRFNNYCTLMCGGYY